MNKRLPVILNSYVIVVYTRNARGHLVNNNNKNNNNNNNNNIVSDFLAFVA